jgi:translation initiation factor IF-3
LDAAAEKGMDLVEVSPNAEPPVCKIIDYGKYKKQNNAKLKEMKFHPKTDTHDYNFKMKNVRKFLMKGDRVKVSVVFRGREIVHKDIGKDLLDRVHEDLSDIAQSEILCNMEGRAMVSSYIPDKVKLKALSE